MNCCGVQLSPAVNQSVRLARALNSFDEFKLGGSPIGRLGFRDKGFAGVKYPSVLTGFDQEKPCFILQAGRAKLRASFEYIREELRNV